MGAENDARVLRVDSKLCHSPTDLTIPFPHGGVEIGITMSHDFVTEQRAFEIVAEELDDVVDVAVGAVRARFDAVLRQHDKEALELLFPVVVVDTEPHVTIPGGVLPGRLGSGEAVTLVVSPESVGEPGLVVFRAIPRLATPVVTRYGNLRERLYRVTFRAIEDASGRLAREGLLSEITL